MENFKGYSEKSKAKRALVTMGLNVDEFMTEVEGKWGFYVVDGKPTASLPPLVQVAPAAKYNATSPAFEAISSEEKVACPVAAGPVATTEAPATGKGIKIEKNREERNGVKRPSTGGMCRAVWDLLDEVREMGIMPTAKHVKTLATEHRWNQNNASIEFYQWRKFHGIRGRQA